MITFSTLLAGAQELHGELVLDVPLDWMQGRSVFGGLQAALAVRAMRTLVPAAPLRTLQMTFVAPASGLLRVRAQVLRTGQSATHVEARIIDGSSTLALVVGVFGVARSSAVKVVPQQAPVASERPIELPFVPGVMPAFTQHFAARWLRGALPFTGSTATEQVVEIDLRDSGSTTESHLLAIADFVPPLALSHLRAPANGSTLTWMLELLGADLSALPLAGWRVDVALVAAHDGYTSQSVMVWGPGGVPVAISRQSMLVFG